MTHIAAWISAIAAAVSVGAAIWASRKSAKAQETANRLQARLAEIEEQREEDRLVQKVKAELRAELLGKDKEIACTLSGSQLPRLLSHGMVYTLRISNVGEAPARNVTVTIDGKPVLERPAVPEAAREIRQVGPGSSFGYPLAITRGCHPPFEIDIAWEDDSGVPGQFKTTLTF